MNEKILTPLVVFSAIISVYVFFRSNGKQNSAVVIPSPESSGVLPAYTSSGAVQPVQYNVAPITVSPAQAMSDPFSAFSGSSNSDAVPAYIGYNRSALADPTAQNATPAQSTATQSSDCGCGCGGHGGCGSGGSSGTYSDGSIGSPLAISYSQQAAKSKPQIRSAFKRISSFNTQNYSSPVPTLTSLPMDGAL